MGFVEAVSMNGQYFGALFVTKSLIIGLLVWLVLMLFAPKFFLCNKLSCLSGALFIGMVTVAYTEVHLERWRDELIGIQKDIVPKVKDVEPPPEKLKKWFQNPCSTECRN